MIELFYLLVLLKSQCNTKKRKSKFFSSPQQLSDFSVVLINKSTISLETEEIFFVTFFVITKNIIEIILLCFIFLSLIIRIQMQRMIQRNVAKTYNWNEWFFCRHCPLLRLVFFTNFGWWRVEKPRNSSAAFD